MNVQPISNTYAQSQQQAQSKPAQQSVASSGKVQQPVSAVEDEIGQVVQLGYN